MPGQYYYKLVPESKIPASTRSTAKRALAEASWYWDLHAKPGLWWIMPTSGPGPDVVKVHPGPIGGFSRTGRRDDGLWDWDIYLLGNLSLRETFKTVAHEVAHLYCIGVGYGSWVTRDRRATEQEEREAHETFAERFAERFTKFYFER